MTRHCILLVSGLLLASIPISEGDNSITMETLVKRHGYPFEQHHVKTPDGYILAIHRIPYSSRVNTTSPRSVVFLMHGLFTSSSCWILSGTDNALPYMLSDAGFDIWLGNARGTQYSRRHVTLSTQSQRFWNFDWHHIGMIDLPAMIDYVRLYTGQKQVQYIGHSQGTTSFLLLNTLNLKFKSRIKSAHLLGPVAFMNHMTLFLAKTVFPLVGLPNPIVEVLGSIEVVRHTKAFELFGYRECNDRSEYQVLCTNFIRLFSSSNGDNLNTIVPDIIATGASGASINQIIHYAQEYNSGYFRQFDYGPDRNLIEYGSRQPPNYPLEKIDVPLFLYYSVNDVYAAVVDVRRLIHQLSNSTLRRVYKVPHPKFSHLDFLTAVNVKEQVYDAVMEDVESMK